MLENFKKKIAHYLVKRRYLTKHDGTISFNKIVSDSLNYLIVMPQDDGEFLHSGEILKYLLIHKKSLTLFLPEHKINVLSDKSKFRFISFLPANITKFFLPDADLVSKLESAKFDVVIDLNRGENVFMSAVSNIVNSDCRIGFEKEFSDGYYNLQVVNSSENPEISFRNFLNFLKMF